MRSTKIEKNAVLVYGHQAVVRVGNQTRRGRWPSQTFLKTLISEKKVSDEYAGYRPGHVYIIWSY